MNQHKVLLITGAARRIGRALAEYLHRCHYNIIVHYRNSEKDAAMLVAKLNQQRENSAVALSADFANFDSYQVLISAAIKCWGRLDGIINNASSFFSTPIAATQEQQWDDLFASNAKAPFFLAQAATAELQKTNGSIINIIDIHGLKPLKDYPIYSSAKASLIMLTKALALELAPNIRVNAIAPGNILWPEGDNSLDELTKQKLLKKILLQRQGHPQDIAETAEFLLRQSYITGQIIAVDGGKTLC